MRLGMQCERRYMRCSALYCTRMCRVRALCAGAPAPHIPACFAAQEELHTVRERADAVEAQAREAGTRADAAAADLAAAEAAAADAADTSGGQLAALQVLSMRRKGLPVPWRFVLLDAFPPCLCQRVGACCLPAVLRARCAAERRLRCLL